MTRAGGALARWARWRARRAACWALGWLAGRLATDPADAAGYAVARRLLAHLGGPDPTPAACVTALHALWIAEAAGEPWTDVHEALLAAVRRVQGRLTVDAVVDHIAHPLALRVGPPGLQLADLRAAAFLPPADHCDRMRAADAVAAYTAAWLDRVLAAPAARER